MKQSLYYILLFLLLFNISCSDDDGTEAGEYTHQESNVDVYITNRGSSISLKKMDGVDFSSDVSDLVIRLDTTDVKQEIEGFGASLTGSSAYLIKRMSNVARQKLLEDLFTAKGIDLKYLRLTIGSSDFSIGNYTYCDEANISKFAIPEIDKQDLLPVLKEIISLKQDIRLMGSPWSAPAWMKGNKHLYGGSLSGAGVYDDFAEYFVKYVKAYQAEGIKIDAITLQNEPMHEINTYPTMKMEWEEQNTIIKDYLGPKFRSNNINTKIFIWDHNFDGVDYPINILDDINTRQYVGGSAFHGYGGAPANLDKLITRYPNMPIYFTEQSGGGWNTDDPIGNMLYYMKDMLIPTINRGSKNFLMWNLALDKQNGPVTTTGGGCQDCRGVVTIDGDNYTVNEEYYLLGHFSKFIQSGAHRIGYTISGAKPNDLEISTFINPDKSKVVVVLNQSGQSRQFTVRTGDRKFTYNLYDQSVISFVYQ
jgi:O-Glycosyl hydrolase